ncbi:MAG: glucose-1-phosphate adenylyltransferase [Thermoanaerobaculia bacterium]
MPSTDRVVTAILGGGQGTRLHPLTRDRAKPAVPVAGKFRLIDIPISNSLHAGIDRVYVLTQFSSASLHRHIAQTYRFDVFSAGFVNILAAEQTAASASWYQGTADAVRQNLHRLEYQHPTEILVLSGDQLYRMDLRAFVEHQREHRADLTVAVCAVDRREASSFGVMRIDGEGRIVEFVEKPKEPSVIDSLIVPEETLERLGFEPRPNLCLISMGIYAFRPEVLKELLTDTPHTDFGKEVIPAAIGDHRVFAFGYSGYWRDIGTIPAFHQANLELTLPVPPMDLHSEREPIFTHPRFLPGSKVRDCHVRRSVLCEGGVLSGATIHDSVIGIRSVVQTGAVLERTVMMGANSYEWESPDPDRPAIGVGRDCLIRNAILDLDVRIGDGARLLNEAGIEEAEEATYSIRGGVIVIPRGASIPPGTVI